MQDVMAAIDTAKDATMQAVTSPRGGLLDAVKSIAEVVTLLRSLGADKALRSVSLPKPRISLVSLGLFATGVALGAGLGMLFAPTSGRQARGKMRQELRRVGAEVKAKALAAAEEAEVKVEAALESAEEAAEHRRDGREAKGKRTRRHAATASKATA